MLEKRESLDERLNILLVEDQFLIATVEMHELQNQGHHVMHALHGEDALEIVKKNEHAIDLILMDIDLGKGMDGVTTAEKIRLIRDIPVIFLSSHTEQSILEKTERISAYGYVPKHSSHIVLDNAIKMARRLFKSNQDLLKQKTLYEDLYQNSPSGYHSISPDGNITRINDTALNMLGYTREEVISQLKISDLLSNTFEDKHFLENLFKMKQTNVEMLYKKKDNTLLPVVFNSEILPNKEGHAMIVRVHVSDRSKQIITDYELRKTNYELEVHQIELELQNEELKLRTENNRLTSEKYAVIFDDSPLGYVSLDPSGKILDLNESCATIFQKERALLKGQNISSFLFSESVSKFEKFLKKVFYGEFSLSCDLRLKNEGTIYQDINLRKINVNENDRCFLLIFNISDLKKIKTKLNLFNAEIF